MSALSATAGFTFSAFGSVQPTAKVVRKTTIIVPSDRARDFTNSVAFFASLKNTDYLEFEFPGTPAEAALYRKQVAQWADDNNRVYAIPVFVPEHIGKRAQKDDDGNPVLDADENPVKEDVTIPANDVPEQWNKDLHIAFRIGKVRSTKDAADAETTDTETVTVTQGEPAAPSPERVASRNTRTRDGRS